jgi:hypothetical protein
MYLEEEKKVKYKGYYVSVEHNGSGSTSHSFLPCMLAYGYIRLFINAEACDVTV